MHSARSVLALFSLLFGFALCAKSQVVPYAGVIGGVSTLSADAASQPASAGLALSAYSPQNGGALNIFFGVHFHNYLSAQANYIWNANDLTLSSASSDSNTFYEQTRSSSQHAFVADFLIYFRKRGKRIRPYLGTGGGVVHLTSATRALLRSGGTPSLPPDTFSSTRPVFRSHVGIDLTLARSIDFRYSFSESIGKNDISRHLSPRASRRLANFQNLFGFVVRF